MSDLIDRQAAIDAVLHHGEIENNYTDLYRDGYCDGVYDSADILKDLPSAVPKMGMWVPQVWNASGLRRVIHSLPKCSICGFSAYQAYPYCPSCGSRMEDQTCRE